MTAAAMQVVFNAVLTEDEGEIQKARVLVCVCLYDDVMCTQANARAEMEWKISNVSEIAYVKQRPADERDSICCGRCAGDYIWIKAQFEVENISSPTLHSEWLGQAKDEGGVEQRNYMCCFSQYALQVLVGALKMCA